MNQVPNPQTEEQEFVHEVRVRWNMQTNALDLQSGSPTVILLGILQAAISMVTEQQTVARLKIQELHDKAEPEHKAMADGIPTPTGIAHS